MGICEDEVSLKRGIWDDMGISVLEGTPAIPQNDNLRREPIIMRCTYIDFDQPDLNIEVALLAKKVHGAIGHGHMRRCNPHAFHALSKLLRLQSMIATKLPESNSWNNPDGRVAVSV